MVVCIIACAMNLELERDGIAINQADIHPVTAIPSTFETCLEFSRLPQEAWNIRTPWKLQSLTSTLGTPQVFMGISE